MKKEVGENSFGVAGVVLGIISTLSLSVPGIVFGITGLVFSLKQKKIGKNKWSKAGIILNVIGIILGIVAIVLLVYYTSNYVGQLEQLQGLGNA